MGAAAVLLLLAASAGFAVRSLRPGAARPARAGPYQLAGQPVTLLYGRIPAWRAFGPGMTPGPDVGELQHNLAALGFDPCHQITASGQFGWATGLVEVTGPDLAAGLNVEVAQG